MIRFTLIFFASAGSAWADSWSGVLVDSDCYETARRNVNPRETSPGSMDLSANITSCLPSEHTKKFSIVQQDWSSLRLNSAGNAKAAELVHTSGAGKRLGVTITGEKHKDTVNVETLATSK